MSDGVFLVSSAIHAKHGVYDTQTRLEQTIETCKSIKNKCDADIIVLDGGYQDITEKERDILSPYINKFYSFADAENVQQLQQVPNLYSSLQPFWFAELFRPGTHLLRRIRQGRFCRNEQGR